MEWCVGGLCGMEACVGCAAARCAWHGMQQQGQSPRPARHTQAHTSTDKHASCSTDISTDQHMATLTLLPCTPSSAAHTRPHKAAQHQIRCQRGATPYLLCSPRPICGALCSLPPSCRPCSSALVDTTHCAGSTPQPRHCTLPLALDACLASGEAQHP